MSVSKQVDQLRKGGQDTYRCQSGRSLLEPLWLSKKGKYTGVKEALRQSQPFGGELLGIEFFKMGSFRVVFSF